MIVVGGTYREICREPAIDYLFGSGLRAAFAISRGCKQLEFISIVDVAERNEVEAVARSFGFIARLTERKYPIQFYYDVPIGAPRMIPHNPIIAAPERIACSGEAMLVFGILEAISDVHAERLVLDPQGVKPITEQINWSAKHVAVIGNKSEIQRMSTGNADLRIERHAQNVREKLKADVVVVKCGALGALVVESSEVSPIGVFPTAKVNPLGSGDVFSAVFAYYWAERGTSAKEAARLASKATSAWVSREPFQVINKEGNVVSPESDNDIYAESVSVYLAAPFFTVAERWLVELCRTALSDLGAQVFSPLHDVGWGPPDFVAPADLGGLRKADSVLALLDGLDSGTMYELGYATAQGIPVVGVSSDKRSADLTMVVGNGARIYEEPSTAVYDAIWQGILHSHSPSVR